MKKKELKNAKTFDEFLDIKYGPVGSSKRDMFEEKARYFVISEMLKEARKQDHMTQDELAQKIGTKKVIYQDSKTGSVTYSFPYCTAFLSSGLAEG